MDVIRGSVLVFLPPNLPPVNMLFPNIVLNKQKFHMDIYSFVNCMVQWSNRDDQDVGSKMLVQRV